LSTASRGIAEVITHHYTQNIDLKDAKTVLSNSGTAIMGSATASGMNRSEEAISKALDSPLLNDNKITGAKNVLLLIVSGADEITIDEIGEINDFIQSEAKSDVNIIMGVGEDESLGDAISVTIVATGFNKDQQHEISNTEAKKIIHTLDVEQEATYDFTEKRINASVTEETKIPPVSETPVVENKIVHELGDDFEDEFEIIPTTELIKNIDVVYEEISLGKVDDFVITSIKEDKEETPIQVEEENQISLTFDLPISEVVKTSEEKVEKVDVKNIEVVSHEVVEPVKVVEEDVYFSLEEYSELESNLTKASKQPEVVQKNENSDLNFTLRSEENKIEESIKEQEVVDHKEVSPLDLTIEELQKRAAQRRQKMKNFNYKFVNRLSKNIDEIEKEPAYKRMGVKLEETSHSSEISQSRTTLEVDDNEDIQFRSNNSFLHDNVD